MSAMSSQLRAVEQTGTGLYRRARRALGLPAVAPAAPRPATVRETVPLTDADVETRARQAQEAATAAIRAAARVRVSTEPAVGRNAFTLTIQILPLVVFVALAIIFAAWIPELQRMY